MDLGLAALGTKMDLGLASPGTRGHAENNLLKAKPSKIYPQNLLVDPPSLFTKIVDLLFFLSFLKLQFPLQGPPFNYPLKVPFKVLLE